MTSGYLRGSNNLLAGASAQAVYTIEESLRLRSSASAYLNRTQGAGNRRIFTLSAWVKRGSLGSYKPVFTGQNDSANSDWDTLEFNSSDVLRFYLNGASSGYFVTTQVFRDPSAWYHIVVAVDTTQATSTNRVKIYVNGAQITNFTTATYPSQNFDCWINKSGRVVALGANYYAVPNAYFDGYLAEVNFIDGQALTPSSFGDYNEDTGVWQPAKYAGSYGTNGFYLNFSDATNTTTLVADSSGNGNDWTPNNISLTAGVTYDSMTDTPTPYADGGNYAVLNPLFKPYGTNPPTLSEANLKAAPNAASYQNTFSTIGASSGKFYAELLCNGTPNSANYFGVSSAEEVNYLAANLNVVGATSSGFGIVMLNGKKRTSGVETSYGSGFANGDIMQFALDLDNSKVYFGKNGTWFASGDPVAGTNAAFTGLSGTFFIGGSLYNAGFSSVVFNFGQRPFAYTPPAGFKSLHTGNLPDSAIVDGSDYFNTVLYTGDSSTNNTITGVGFEPDFVWLKARTLGGGGNHVLVDSVRGDGNAPSTTKELYSNLTNAESPTNIIGFNSDGFRLLSTGSGDERFNQSGQTYVAWNWKAGGAAVTNTAGSITSQVSASPTAGFSIATFTDTGSACTVGHGLGVAPDVVIAKFRGASGNWSIYHKALGPTKRLIFTTSAELTSSGWWNNTAPTSTVFSLGSGLVASTTQVAYCFSEVPGYSSFGSYVGNGSTDGPFVYLGFRPAFVMIKCSTGTSNWTVFDALRDGYNPDNQSIYANLSAAESTADDKINILSNGFKVIASAQGVNESGFGFIYMAFAENPFKNSLAR